MQTMSDKAPRSTTTSGGKRGTARLGWDTAYPEIDGTCTVNGHKYSSPSILRYIFHIKPH